ncbi:MAG: hypothetical protein PVJ33_17470 [Lysobacterales bacterium]|jgi:hypothetical protein
MYSIDTLKTAFPGLEIVAHHGTDEAEQALLFDREEDTWVLAVLHLLKGKDWTKASYANLSLADARKHYLDHVRLDIERISETVEAGVR